MINSSDTLIIPVFTTGISLPKTENDLIWYRFYKRPF